MTVTMQNNLANMKVRYFQIVPQTCKDLFIGLQTGSQNNNQPLVILPPSHVYNSCTQTIWSILGCCSNAASSTMVAKKSETPSRKPVPNHVNSNPPLILRPTGSQTMSETPS